MGKRLQDYHDLLIDHVLTPWFPRCIDSEYGGFLCDFDQEWKHSDGGRKLLEFQARQTSAAAEMLLCFPHDERLRSAVKAGFSFLNGPLWDHEFGGWYGCTDRAGSALNNGSKHAHGMAYATEACFLVSVALGDKRAAQRGEQALAWLNSHAFDNCFGGYWGPMARDGSVLSLEAATRQIDQLGTPYGFKDMNVNKDVLSMMTTVRGICPSFISGEIYERHIEFVMRCFAGTELPTHWVNQCGESVSSFWKPSETTQLAGMLIEATPHSQSATELVATARRLLEVSFRYGWSHVGGGLLESIKEGTSSTFAERRHVNWWPQFELLKSASYAERIDGNSTHPVHLRESAWQSITTCFLDKKNSGLTAGSRRTFPWRLLRPRAYEKLSRKGYIWKDASHEARALIRLLQIDRILSGKLPTTLDRFSSTTPGRPKSIKL